jgi:hypothetical protein
MDFGHTASIAAQARADSQPNVPEWAQAMPQRSSQAGLGTSGSHYLCALVERGHAKAQAVQLPMYLTAGAMAQGNLCFDQPCH